MLRNDHVSGASELLGAATAQILTTLPDLAPSVSSLLPGLRRLVAEQPAVGALHRLAGRVVETARAAERAGLDAASARREIADAVRAFAADFEAAGERVVQQAAEELLPAEGWVATVSRSSLVERAFLAASRRGKRCGALVAESRPLWEGRTLAKSLHAAGLPVLLATDAALPLLLARADLVVVGADAVRPRTFVNKVGTGAVLLAARELARPAHALSQTAKFLPGRVPLLDLPARDPAQVWESAPPGLLVVNPTFEEVALALLRSVVTERGFLPPGEAGSVAENTSLAAELTEARVLDG